MYCPVNTNLCIDPGESVRQQNFCVRQGNEGLIQFFCYKNGGLGTYDSTVGYAYPEWSGKSAPGICEYDDFQEGCIIKDHKCHSGHCPIVGTPANCIKQENYGDPLLCCLRDYQCKDGTDPTGKSCFSNDAMNATCPPEFRSMDTPYCKYLTTQFCLGNLSSGQGAPYSLQPGKDFTSLWIDSQLNDTISSLPAGTQYQTGNDEPCTIDQLNLNTGAPKSGNRCQFSGVIPSNGITDTSTYTIEDPQPICQRIFWRTLYGNEPTFKNQYWNIPGGPRDCPTPGEDICENTSILPGIASCSSTAYAGTPTATGITWGKEMLTLIYSILKTKGVSVLTPITSGTDQPFFLDFLYPVCARNPELCEDFLYNECGNVDPKDFEFNQNLWNWCGCYMNDSRYKKYTDTFGVAKECTPYCNAPNVIPLRDGDTTNILHCTSSVCIMDDISITLAQTRFQGSTNNLNFSQICNGCGSGYGSSTGVVNEGNFNTTGNSTINSVSSTSCNCIISNFTLNTLGTTILGDGVNLSQACNGNSTCYNTVTNVDGTETAVPIDCANTGIGISEAIVKERKNLETKAKNISIYWTIFIGFVVICLIILIWLLVSPRKLPESDILINKKIPLYPPAYNPDLYKY